MVQKAWAAGFRALVAVSAPTSLAVEAARRANLTLVGFVRADGFNVYVPGLTSELNSTREVRRSGWTPGAARRAALEHLRGADVVVLGLPRGGVPVAAEIAAALDAPLDVIVVRKLGTPGHEELGMGAIGEGDVRVLNDDIVSLGRSQRRTAHRRRGGRARRSSSAGRSGSAATVHGSISAGKTAIVVDDGIATGSTAIAALQVARALGAARTVLATPVAPHGIEAAGRRRTPTSSSPSTRRGGSRRSGSSTTTSTRRPTPR